MNTCPHCGLVLSTIGNSMNRGNHVRWCKKNSNRKQKKVKICKYCNSLYTGRGKTCGKALCIHKAQSHDTEMRLYLSKKRKIFLKENPDLHPWKQYDKFKSVPCEELKKRLYQEDIEFIEEFQPLEDRFFSIDIFIPSKGIGIEVNGNQHYNRDGSLNKYYQERHDLIESIGIRLIELPYYNIFKFSIEEIISCNDCVVFIKQSKEKKIKKKNFKS